MAAHHLDEKSAQEWEESVDHTTAIALAASYVPGSPEEKRLLRKLDFRIIVSGYNPRCVFIQSH
jgi:hypothetical protein